MQIVNNRQLKLGGLRLGPETRRHRPVDSGPITNITCSIEVGRSRVEARDTAKMGLIRSIAFVYTAAHVAGLTGVGGINRNNRHACTRSLVADVLTQLSKCPIAVPCALLWPRNPRPRTNTFEICAQVAPGKHALRVCSLADTPRGAAAWQ